MTHEAPRPTPEEIAAELIDQALAIREQGLQQEVLVHSKVFENSPLLAARFRLQKTADSRLADLIDDLLKVDDGSAVSYESGTTDSDGYKYMRWVAPSRKYPGLFTLQETARKKRIRVAERSSILVSRENLLEFRNWSEFFYGVLQRES